MICWVDGAEEQLCRGNRFFTKPNLLERGSWLKEVISVFGRRGGGGSEATDARQH